MSQRGKLLYAVDVVILVAFLLSGVSGLVLWLGGPGGYQGGRNPNYGQLTLGLSHSTWDDLHVWTSFVMGAGVLVHLALHWSWTVCMTRRLFARPKSRQSAPMNPEMCKLEV